MNYNDMALVMESVFRECAELRKAGQAEYAHRADRTFANFERVAERTGMTREQVLLVYLEKHLDGIHSYVKGHRSQRESVKGRINDAIVYLCLLRGMCEDAGDGIVEVEDHDGKPLRIDYGCDRILPSIDRSSWPGAVKEEKEHGANPDRRA